jgi:hypothetical protein
MSTDPALAAKHRAMWASGDYPAVVTDLVARLGPILVEATGIGPADRVLDVAAGTGNVAIPAAHLTRCHRAPEAPPRRWPERRAPMSLCSPTMASARTARARPWWRMPVHRHLLVRTVLVPAAQLPQPDQLSPWLERTWTQVDAWVAGHTDHS